MHLILMIDGCQKIFSDDSVDSEMILVFKKYYSGVFHGQVWCVSES